MQPKPYAGAAILDTANVAALMRRLRRGRLLRHHDLAEVLVGFHVLERLPDLAEWIDLVDRQFQFAGFHRGPDILSDLIEYLADFLDRRGCGR